MHIREATQDDWDGILNAANAALGWDDNSEWLANRQIFDWNRYHIVAEEEGAIIAYAAIEEGPVPNVYRVFMVMPPNHLNGSLGEEMYGLIQAELDARAAAGIWVREYAQDDALIAFFVAKGLQITDRFTPPDYPEMIVLKAHYADD